MYTKLTKKFVCVFFLSFLIVKPSFSEEKMLSCEIMGGLGNQLFQVATTLATAWDYGYTPVFPLLTSSPSMLDPRPVYWDTVFKNVKTKPEHLFQNYEKYYEKKEKMFCPFDLGSPYIKLVGYWQTEKYFSSYRSRILSVFQLPDVLQESVDNRFYELIGKHEGPVVSMHLRLGDYVTIQGFMCLWRDEFKHYYTKAISFFPKDTLFMIFSDDSLYAKQFCKQNFPSQKMIFPHEEDFMELYLMAKCDHNIIANSTFSWWGAYLNRNPNKIVVSPKEWTVKDSYGIYFQDYLPEDWISISVLDR